MHRGPRLSEPCTPNHAIVRGTECRKIVNNHCQDTNYVLVWFGNKAGEGRKAYGKFMDEVVDQGRRPDLVGGGLVRSMGGWSVVKPCEGQVLGKDAMSAYWAALRKTSELSAKERILRLVHFDQLAEGVLYRGCEHNWL